MLLQNLIFYLRIASISLTLLMITLLPKVRRAGFPNRMLYEDFVKEFRAFTPAGAQFYNMTDAEELAIEMLASPQVSGTSRELLLYFCSRQNQSFTCWNRCP